MKPRILIVDDDIVTLKIFKRHLEDKYDITTENSGFRFIEKMDTYDVDLILMDLEMPIINGLQAFDEILKNPRIKNIPVAFLSGVANPSIVRNLMEKGSAGYLVKTMSKSELIDKIDGMLQNAGPRVVSPEVMIIEGNIEVLKSMRQTLSEDIYTVKTVRNLVEASKYLESHQPSLIIIGHDQSGISVDEVYNVLAETVRKKHIRTLRMEEPLFETELLDKVADALE